MVIGRPDSGDPLNPRGRDLKRLDLFAVQAFLNLFPSRIFSGGLEPVQVARQLQHSNSVVTPLRDRNISNYELGHSIAI